MATVRKSVIVPHPCATMFDLVEDVAAYPEFLPWVAGVEVLERGPAAIRARLEIDYHGLRTRIATRNAKERPSRMTLELEEGPFERFFGEWRFTPLGPDGCRIELAIDYALAAGPFEALLAPALGQVASTLVERFVERADR